MRDLTLVVMLLGLAWMAWRRPWLGVVGLALIGAMHPQSYGGEWMSKFPIYKTLFLATILGLAAEFWRTRRVPSLPWDWRLALLALLFAHFVVTTHFAVLPSTARDRLIEVSLLLPPLLLTLWMADTRERLSILVAVTAAAIALVALKGGYWAVMTGFQDRVYGPPGSQIGGNNEFAVALAMTIPLLVLWLRQAQDRALRGAIMLSILLCYVAALTSWSRGGLVSLAVMSALLVWNSRRKHWAILLIAVGVAVATLNLPDKWHARMETLATYQEDQSFQSREATWRKGLAYVQRNPWTGSGFEGWRAVTVEFNRRGEPSTLDWHSAYIEALVEHGIPGLVLWLALLVGTMVGLTRMIGRGNRLGEAWMVDYGAMLRASLVAYAVGGITLGITYWELMFQILAYSLIAIRLAGRMQGGRADSSD